MQKMRTIFPTICIAFLLCACSVGERGVRLDNSGKTEDSCVEAIFEILNESDRDFRSYLQSMLKTRQRFLIHSNFRK